MKLSSKPLSQMRGIVLLGVSTKGKKISLEQKEKKILTDLLGWSLEKELSKLELEGSEDLLHAIPLHGGTKLQGVVIVNSPKKSSEDYVYDRLRLAGAKLQKLSAQVKAQSIMVASSVLKGDSSNKARAVYEGFLLNDYEFTKYKLKSSKKKSHRATNFSFLESEALNLKDLKKVEHEVKGVFATRDLVSTPAKDCTPKDMANFARSIGRKANVTVKVFNEKQLISKKMNGILSVGMASRVRPAFITLDYKPKTRIKQGVPTVGIVGKGVTFDSGGLSIKVGKGMEDMKCDMAGAGAVLGTMQALSDLNLPIRVKGYVPTVENMIEGNALKPGDVIKMMSGKTVEVLNTDAEGRLILADALHYADNDGCDIIIDLATLTGSCVVALGESFAGLFTRDSKLSEDLMKSSKETGERMWPLPLPPEYKKALKSNVADIKNIGGRYGGAITAALFLQHFVEKARWAHLDIAGPAFADSQSGYLPVGGTGYGVRMLLRFLRSHCE